ncbi:MAG: hypothetical protein ABJN98_15920 [Roseibium sp.]
MNSDNNVSHHTMTFFELLSRDPTEQIALSEDTLLQDVSHLLENPADLVAYCESHPKRLGWAIWRLCDSSSSDCLRLLTDSQIPEETRCQLTDNLKNLFSKLFDPHCDQVLQGSLKKGQYLNIACSLFWDIAPLGPTTARPAGIADACADVMRFQLTIANLACRESALVGIEHWIDAEPQLMAAVLKDYDVDSEPVAELQKRAVYLSGLLGTK